MTTVANPVYTTSMFKRIQSGADASITGCVNENLKLEFVNFCHHVIKFTRGPDRFALGVRTIRVGSQHRRGMRFNHVIYVEFHGGDAQLVVIVKASSHLVEFINLTRRGVLPVIQRNLHAQGKVAALARLIIRFMETRHGTLRLDQRGDAEADGHSETCLQTPVFLGFRLTRHAG